MILYKTERRERGKHKPAERKVEIDKTRLNRPHGRKTTKGEITMEARKLLNREAFTELFNNNAVMIESQNVLPYDRAIQLFGQDAVDFAQKMSKRHFSGYGIGNYTLYFITLYGAELAATYNNVDILSENSGK